MRPAFFVQNNMVERVTIPVAQFARREGIALEDRSSTPEFDVENCGIDWTAYQPVLPFGSVQLLRKLKTSPSLGRYIWHDDIFFSAETWKHALGKAMLNYDGQVVRVCDVPALLAEGPQHIRPDAEDKAFIAKVFDLDSWSAVCAERGLRSELECWASPVKQIRGEWRCWVVGGNLIETSRYRKDGRFAPERGSPPEIRWYAEHALRRFKPAPCVVMDVAVTDKGFRVVEFNPIHGSGWYAADSDSVLRAWLDWSCKHF